MSWLRENLQILATLGSASAIYVLVRNNAKKEVETLIKKLDKIQEEIEIVDRKASEINFRVAKLQGAFDERRYWEAKGVGRE